VRDTVNSLLLRGQFSGNKRLTGMRLFYIYLRVGRLKRFDDPTL
jgi:hypothetical protein